MAARGVRKAGASDAGDPTSAASEQARGERTANRASAERLRGAQCAGHNVQRKGAGLQRCTRH